MNAESLASAAHLEFPRSAMIIREIDLKERESPDVRAWYVMRVERLAHLLPPVRSSWAAFLRNREQNDAAGVKWRVWLAENSGSSDPIGFAEVCLHPRDDGTSYAAVYVRPSFRRQGTGSRLLDALKGAARSASRHKLSGPSYGIPTDPAREFFQRFGITPVMGTARVPGCRVREALESLNGPELPSGPELLPATLQPRLSFDDFAAAVSLGQTGLLPHAQAAPDQESYKHYLREADRKEQHQLSCEHKMILRTLSDSRPLASVAIRTGDAPTALIGAVIAPDVNAESMAPAVVKALLLETVRLFPRVELVFTPGGSRLHPTLVMLGAVPMAESSSWRVSV